MMKNLMLICLVIFVNDLFAQMKFGVHADPGICFMDSDYAKVENSALNFNFSFGVEAEYRFSEVAGFTFGLDFSMNNGGSLLYKYGGVLFKNSEFDNNRNFKNLVDVSPGSTEIDMYAFTKVNYRINYLELPLGVKFRTEEFGSSYVRAFFHLPIIKIMVPVMASAKIFAPDATADGFETDLNPFKFGVPQAGSGNSEDGLGYVIENNVWKDITPIQLSAGLGAGVEFAPTNEDGIKLFAGVYYHTGILDVTNGFGGNTTYTEALTVANPLPQTQDRNPRNAMHHIMLRIGVVF